MRRAVSVSVIAVSLLAPIVSLATTPDEPAAFKDVPADAWFAEYVQLAQELGIVSGYKDEQGNLTEYFGPGDPVTIVQALKIAVEGAGYDAEAYGAVCNAGVGDHWAAAYVCVAQMNGFSIYSSYIARRDPADLDLPATRAVVAQIFVDAFKPPWKADTIVPEAFSDVDLDKPEHYSGAVNSLLQDGVITGDGGCVGADKGLCPKTTFRPTDGINRAESVKIVMGARATYGESGEGMKPEPTVQNDATATVIYTSKGFTPEEMHVRAGTNVRFHNDSSSPMWVASDPHPEHTDLEFFDAGTGIAPGGTYEFDFLHVGKWGFHNHAVPYHTGTITVE